MVEPITISVAGVATAIGWCIGYFTRKFTENTGDEIKDHITDVDRSFKSNIVSIREVHKENHSELMNILYALLILVLLVIVIYALKAYHQFVKKMYTPRVPRLTEV